MALKLHGTLTNVHSSLMPLEIITLMEPLPAVGAGVPSLSCVDALVFPEARINGEAFPTRGADKGLLDVCSPVTHEFPAIP